MLQAPRNLPWIHRTLLDTLGESCYRRLDGQGEIVGKQIELLQGTLDMLILKAVSLELRNDRYD